MKQQYSSEKAFWMGIFLLAFPTSFFFNAVYTESLFFMLFVMSLYYFYNRKPFLSLVTSLFLGMTRVVGVLVIIPYIVETVFGGKKYASWRKTFFLVAAPVVGLGLYMLFLNFSVHDPIGFLSVQPSFGANRSTHLILLPQVIFRYMKIFITANRDFNYFVALSEFSFFLFSFVASAKLLRDSYINKHNFGISIALISLCMILVPSLTGTFSSMPRYTLLCFSNMIVLAQIKSVRMKATITVIFLLIQLVLWPLFIQGYFVS